MKDQTKILLINFLKSFTRLIVQANLYRKDHPQVVEAASEAVKNLELFYAGENQGEISLALEKDRLLVNGVPFLQADKLPNSLTNMFKKMNMDTINFKKGVTADETIAFSQIHNSKMLPDDFIKANSITSISVSKSTYIKATTVAAPKTGTPGGAGAAKTDIKAELGGKNFEDSLKTIVSKLTADEGEQKQIINNLFEKFKTEVEEKVNKAVEELKKEKNRIENDYIRTEAVIANIASGVLTVDKSGNIIMMTPEAQNVTGKPLREISGKKIFDITNIESQVLNLAAEIKQDPGKTLNKDIKTKAREDLAKTIKNATTLVKNEDGKIVGTLSLPTDAVKLKEIDQLKEDFISTMTHELRSPLTAIKMALDILSKEKMPQNVSNMLNAAIRNSERLNSIIGDILDFSKLQSGKMVFRQMECDAVEIARNAMDSMKSWSNSKGIAVSMIKEENLPKIHADSRRTEQILINLLSNSLKFTPQGGKIEISVDRGREALANFIFFSIKDTGCGIKKEDQSRIFDKFVQAASGEKAGGTGLGLAITKAMTVMQGGTIGVKSESGKGAIFTVGLPVFRQQEQPAEEKPEIKPWWKKLFGI